MNEKVEKRSGIDCREFVYTVYIPERRSGKDRRKGKRRPSKGNFQEGFTLDRSIADITCPITGRGGCAGRKAAPSSVGQGEKL